jgi:hypothetical protein
MMLDCKFCSKELTPEQATASIICLRFLRLDRRMTANLKTGKPAGPLCSACLKRLKDLGGEPRQPLYYRDA